MAIDKIIPRKLVKDVDERLVQEGDMIDALNVTISEGGEGTEGVIKNSYGTSAAIGSIEADGNYTVVGRCVDQSMSVVYFFVRDNIGSDHQIVKYKSETHSFVKVIASSVLNFPSNHNVKADVISSNFGGGSEVQSILYFTDNTNPPRKINVDRAILGEYSNFSDADLEKAISVIKPAPQKPVEFAFETDGNIYANNFRDRYFQFATQLVYTDGEESAISTYSKLAVSDASAYDGLNAAGQAQPSNTHNVLRLFLNYSPSESDDRYIPDVKFIRLLARDGNDGAFVKVDEFDPSESIDQKIYGASKTIYDSNSGSYLFYNAKSYGAVDQNTVNKTYDNVPLKAEGQAITNNRLFYSNYEEGREKVDLDPSKVTLSVEYSSDQPFKDVFDDTASVVTASGDEVTIDLLAGTSFDDFETNGTATKDTVVPAGTTISVEFSYDPVGTVSNASGPIVTVEYDRHKAGEYNDDSGIWNAFSDLFSWAFGTTDNDAWWNGVDRHSVSFGNGAADVVAARTIPMGPSVSGNITVSVSVTAPSETTVAGLGKLLADKIESVSGTKKWLSRGVGAPALIGHQGTANAGVERNPQDGTIQILYRDYQIDPTTYDYLTTDDAYSFATFAHDDITADVTHDYATFVVKPRLVDIDMTGLFDDTTQRPIGQLADNDTEEVGTNPSYSMGSIGTTQASLTYDYTGGTNGFNFSYTVGSSAGYSPTMSSGFKAGASYDVGVVYYDEYGRSSFVSEIGTAYIKSAAERVASSPAHPGFGAAKIKVEFASDTPAPPSWADSYQVVVSENNTYQDFIQYTTGGAYVPVDDPGSASANEISTDTKIYVSLKPLDIYNERTQGSRKYSFTKGDKLRVLQYDAGTTTEGMTIPSAFVPIGGSNNLGRPIEFDINGVETYENATDNPCCDIDPTSHPEQADQFVGTFVILSAPQIDSGTGAYGQEKYIGFDYPNVFDYHSGSTTSYVGGGASDGLNYWGRKSIVEILTPKQEMGDKFYYEVGQSRKLRQYKNYSLSNYGPEVILDGDVWVRPVSLITGKYDSQHSDWDSPYNPSEWSYIVKSIESLKPSEAAKGKYWSEGRAHLPFRNEAARKIHNGITYSDAFVEDSGFLGLSSFNASLSNFSSLDSQYGAVRFIDNYDDSLVAIQEERMSFLPVKKNIVEYAGNTSGLVVSTDIIGQPTYYSGDYGCGDSPESVLSVDGKVFFVDPSRFKVMMHSGGQLVPISDTGMASYFLDQFNLARDAGGINIASGFDPRTDTYYVTIKPVGTYAGVTVCYNTRFRAWQSNQSFIPDEYATVDGNMLSCKYITSTVGADTANAIIHKHDRTVPRNKFYGTQHNSTLRVVSKLNPSLEKCFDAISIEGSNTWDSTAVTTDKGQTTNAFNFVEKEGEMYSFIGRDTSAKSSSHIKSAGIVNGTPSDESSSVNVSNIDLDKTSILGLELYVLSGSELVKVSDTGTSAVITSASGNQITIEGTIDESIVLDDAKLFAQGSKAVDGDKMRGKYATIDMSNSSTSPVELYCINSHITESKLNHSLGQE